MREVKLISPLTKQAMQKTRVAAYCRVSTNSADQQNSYARQIQVYTNLIQRKPNWEMVEIFADEGLSGMKAENRTEFQRMIRFCELGKIDLIITKSISRFARNAKEALEYVRKLKLLGIGIQFEKEGIYTLSLGDEMLLNTFSAIAQEESKSISQNQRFAIVKRMQSGDYIASNAPYGFRLSDKKLVVYEPEAVIVNEIFQMYLNGCSTTEIANILTEREVPTKSGNEKWHDKQILYILSNERYIGDCLFQKTYRETTVPFKEHVNRGELDQYYASGTHAPIVEKDVFHRVQKLLEKRRETFAKITTQNIYPLTSRIRCSECGSSYRRKIRGGIIKWVCNTHKNDKNACDSNYYSEMQIYDGIIAIINKLRFNDTDILGQIINRLENTVSVYKRNNAQAKQMSQSIAELNAKLLMLEQLRSKGYLAAEIYQAQANEIKNEISAIRNARQEEFSTKLQSMTKEVRELRSIIYEIEEPLDTFDEKLFFEIVQGIEINKQNEMTVTFLGGLKFTENI